MIDQSNELGDLKTQGHEFLVLRIELIMRARRGVARALALWCLRSSCSTSGWYRYSEFLETFASSHKALTVTGSALLEEDALSVAKACLSWSAADMPAARNCVDRTNHHKGLLQPCPCNLQSLRRERWFVQQRLVAPCLLEPIRSMRCRHGEVLAPRASGRLTAQRVGRGGTAEAGTVFLAIDTKPQSHTPNVRPESTSMRAYCAILCFILAPRKRGRLARISSPARPPKRGELSMCSQADTDCSIMAASISRFSR